MRLKEFEMKKVKFNIPKIKIPRKIIEYITFWIIIISAGVLFLSQIKIQIYRSFMAFALLWAGIEYLQNIREIKEYRENIVIKVNNK